MKDEKNTTLTVTRREGQAVRIGPDITVTIIQTGRHSAKINITAPPEVKILRTELIDDS